MSKQQVQLRIDHIAPYLPYKLMCVVDDEDNNCQTLELCAITTGARYECLDFVIPIDWANTDTLDMVHIEDVMPILKPLFSIPQSFVDASPYDTHDEFIEAVENHSIPYNMWFICIQNHFDVFGLIEDGLAIDINKVTTDDSLNFTNG